MKMHNKREVYDKTGIQFMEFNSIFQLDTLRHNGCSALEYADKILFIPDALIYMLTGKAICEYTIASTSQLLNPVITTYIEKQQVLWPVRLMFEYNGHSNLRIQYKETILTTLNTGNSQATITT